ncbi:hypothetical protein VNI00_011690 [Paramarasmius palmivorus]|uniref:Homeobox domain-containing protein n=1 Tax=Paramarasmius palmivorus TaxID=297713 RepID=A0AAW0CE35_9AGAR
MTAPLDNANNADTPSSAIMASSSTTKLSPSSQQNSPKKPAVARVINQEGIALLKDIFHKQNIKSPKGEQLNDILKQVQAIPGCENYKRNNLHTWFYNERGERKRRAGSTKEKKGTEDSGSAAQDGHEVETLSTSSKKRKAPQEKANGDSASTATKRQRSSAKEVSEPPHSDLQSQQPRVVKKKLDSDQVSGPQELTTADASRLSKVFYESDRVPNQATILTWSNALNISFDLINRWVLAEQQKLGSLGSRDAPVQQPGTSSPLLLHPAAQTAPRAPVSRPKPKPTSASGSISTPLANVSSPTQQASVSTNSGSSNSTPSASSTPVPRVGDCSAFKTDINVVLAGLKKKLKIPEDEFEAMMSIYGRDLLQNTKVTSQPPIHLASMSDSGVGLEWISLT